MLESIGVGRDIAVFLIGHFNHPAARRAELIKAFSASEQDGAPEHDRANIAGSGARRGLMTVARYDLSASTVLPKISEAIRLGSIAAGMPQYIVTSSSTSWTCSRVQPLASAPLACT